MVTGRALQKVQSRLAFCRLSEGQRLAYSANHCSRRGATMNHPIDPRALTTLQLARLHDRARAQAADLRSEAMASFWRSIGQWLTGTRRPPAAPQAGHAVTAPSDLSCAH
jgi:hypothetical protein